MDSEILASSMPQAPPDTHVGRCKSCGQPALLPEALELMVVCPRCGTEAKAAELLLLATPDPTTSQRSHDPEFVNAATILAMRAPDDAAAKSKLDSSRQGASGLLVALDRLNRFVGGRRCQSLAALVVLFGIALPLLDHYFSTGRLTLTIVFGDLLLLWVWLLLFSWATSLRDESGRWRASRLGSGLGIFVNGLWEAGATWRHSTRGWRLRNCGLVLLWIGVVQLALHGALTLISAVFVTGTAQTQALPFVPWWLGVLSAGIGLVLLSWGTLDQRRAPSSLTLGAQPASSLASLPSIIDMSEPRQHDFGSSDACRLVLSALARWNECSRKRYGNRDAYVAALARHLQRVAPSVSVRREVWLGRTREMGIVDLVIRDHLLILVQKGFDREAADWSLAQLHACQRTHPRIPKLLVVFDAEKQLLQGSLPTAIRQLREHASAVAVSV